MKRKLLIICICLFAIKGYTQDSIVNYLDRKGKVTTKEKAIIIKVVIKKEKEWLEKIYSTKWILKSYGHFRNKKLTKKVGEFKFYNNIGKIVSIENYNRGGVLEGEFFTFHSNNKSKLKGLYKRGKKTGNWNYFNINGDKIARLTYKKNEVLEYKLWDDYGNVKNEPLVLFKRAKYNGGINLLYLKIKKELGAKFLNSNLKSKIYVFFSVGILGDVKDVKVSPRLPLKYQKIIETFFYNLPKWEPGIEVNQKAKTSFTIPINLN